ncbi:myocilin-like [Teleopsis dalmanni]|uniref:myocilin-like n=1 Tax=Teleopsis dalmanni TaxID=139649 RepID=UPI0018CFC348|nr:myocilin-like [Teleopsis dalmanni]
MAFFVLTATSLPYAGVERRNKLYSTDYNYMDFNVDEVGLWVIYSTYDSNNTLVAKLDAENLRVQYNFNITLDHRKFGEMFIVCGHLYAIDSCSDKNSQIRYVVDLYNGKLLNVDLPFSNPFRKTTTVGYNPLTVNIKIFPTTPQTNAGVDITYDEADRHSNAKLLINILCLVNYA